MANARVTYFFESETGIQPYQTPLKYMCVSKLYIYVYCEYIKTIYTCISNLL